MQTPSPQPTRSVHLTRLYEQWSMMSPDLQESWLSKPHNVKIVINAVIGRCTIEAKAHGIFATLNRLGEVQAMCDNHSPRKFTFQHPGTFHKDIERLFLHAEDCNVVMESVMALIQAAQTDMQKQGWDYNYAEKYAFRQKVYGVPAIGDMYYS